MTIDHIDIDSTLKNAAKLIAEDKGLSPATKSLLEVLVLIITLMVNRLNLNSKNSSKPPSTDPHRQKTSKKKKGNKAGGQTGHTGKTLEKVKNPDKVKVINVDRSELPPGEYTEAGHEIRQVFDIEISRIVTEYQAQVLKDAKGKRFTAPFPKGVTKAVQYGESIKAHSVYMSQFQLIPYDRVRDYFADQLGIPVSVGSIFNFNKEAFGLLEGFDDLVKKKLNSSSLVHADETGINVKGKRFWLHCASNSLWTHFFPHQKRGTDAMNAIGILPTFSGTLCHDHWKPYYKYDCTHALCNAHHLRELTRAWEQDNQSWAQKLIELLEEINKSVNGAGGKLESSDSKKYRIKYRKILKEAEKESPPPDEANRKGKRGRLKRTKSRNLLERLQNFEEDTLRFMEVEIVPFTNNLGENDIRMTKVQQKISGCFRSEEGAQFFCRIRSYISSCRKQDIPSTMAFAFLFKGELPDFRD
ncbi:IS66 family transposase [Desulfotalea psychrophila]|nr:IS66 family transposase [Desulfocapsa sp.]MBN4046019.1 IS66 family transposase [bacterium AH-315-P11]MBN4052833.1 IS66 family transposase [bacterium AH-315-K15]MBN4065057.1 IS66 family transposase [Desulfocapsa sp. AH-315-G09]MBN4071589.1 IS66 family transposase [Desulfotalea psychrophila]